jgi:hypothetical protein
MQQEMNYFFITYCSRGGKAGGECLNLFTFAPLKCNLKIRGFNNGFAG